jgi:DNA-binding NarL/FixJ family response regulator
VATCGKVRTDLSAQEQQVMELVTQGKTNKEIAAALGFSHAAIKNYMSHVYEKLQVTRRAQAASSFLERIRAKSGIGIADLSGSPPA